MIYLLAVADARMITQANQAYRAFTLLQPGVGTVGDRSLQREPAPYDEIKDYANEHSSNDIASISTGTYEN